MLELKYVRRKLNSEMFEFNTFIRAKVYLGSFGNAKYKPKWNFLKLQQDGEMVCINCVEQHARFCR